MGKRIRPKTAPVKRAKTRGSKPKPSAPKAPQVSRSAAAKRGWETRRARAEAVARGESTRVKKEARSKAARAGWQKRHTESLLAEGLHPRSAETFAELPAARQQLLHDMRLTVFGPIGYSEDLTGRDLHGLETLREMVEQKDVRWTVFLQAAEQQNYTGRQARTAFFSPSVRRMMQATAPGLRP